MKFFALIFMLIAITGCGSPVGRGMQKTLHYATLGLVNDPAVSDSAKQDVINHQADNAAQLALEEMIRETFDDYHAIALGTYLLGLGIIAFSLINIPALSFLSKSSWKVGAAIIAGAGALSLYATLAADARMIEWLVYLIGGLFLVGVSFLIYKLMVSVMERRTAAKLRRNNE